MSSEMREEVVSLRRLAEVIRKYGTCAPAALETVANNIERLLARTEAGAPHHPLAICPTCKDYYEVCECTPDAAPVVDGAVALDRCQPCKGSGIVEGGGPYGTPSNCTECHGSGMAIVGDVYAMHEAHTNVAKGRDMPIRRMEAAALVVHDRIRARLTHPHDASGDADEVICEHSGCGHGPQANQVPVTVWPGDKVLMRRGRLGAAMQAKEAK